MAESGQKNGSLIKAKFSSFAFRLVIQAYLFLEKKLDRKNCEEPAVTNGEKLAPTSSNNEGGQGSSFGRDCIRGSGFNSRGRLSGLSEFKI